MIWNFFTHLMAYLEYARTSKPPHYYTAGAALRRLRGEQRSELATSLTVYCNGTHRDNTG